MEDGKFKIICGDALEVMKEMEPESVHCVVTSPPYWGLRDYGVEDGIGLEPTPELYVQHLVEIFREVKRVLRKDGTVWLNLGDSYAGSMKGMGADGTAYAGAKQATNPGSVGVLVCFKPSFRRDKAEVPRTYLSGEGLKPKDLCGIPWRVAFALQADGWWLRQAIIWWKRNCMPGSQKDRPTTDYEFVFLLTKSAQYFYDEEAVREENQTIDDKSAHAFGPRSNAGGATIGNTHSFHPSGRTLRAVWDIPTVSCDWDYCKNCQSLFAGRDRSSIQQVPDPDDPEPDPEKKRKLRLCPKCKRTDGWVDHFAAFTEALPERCIKAGTSEKGVCPECGSPWERIIEKERTFESGSGKAGHIPSGKYPKGLQGCGETLDVRRGPCVQTKIVGWQPTCKCGIKETVPPVILDPFCGSGQTGLGALNLNRSFIGIDLKPEYCQVAEARLKQSTLQTRLAI